MATLRNTVIDDTASLQMPVGTTAQRPTNPVDGDCRYNTDFGYVEYYYKGFWADARSNQGAFNSQNVVVWLDATMSASYPGNGGTWFDLSGNGHNFNVPQAAYKTDDSAITSQAGYFDFDGSDGCAKYPNSNNIISGNVTYFVVTRVRPTNNEWRTLTRHYQGDHHVIIQDGGWTMGMYDNDSGGFRSIGYDQRNLPSTQNTPDSGYLWEVQAYRWRTDDNPSFEAFSNGISIGQRTDSLCRYDRGIGALGCYGNGNTDVTQDGQPWGHIKFFTAHNRIFTDDEIVANTVALRTRFGI